MIVYLDQNIWIELAKISNGLNNSPSAVALLKEIKASTSFGYKYPLSATHLIEFSRISDSQRRSRLGSFMWELSGGVTFVSGREVVEREVEFALASKIEGIKVRELNVLGKGLEHAYGEKMPSKYGALVEREIFRLLLVGDPSMKINPIQSRIDKYRLNFFNHLNLLQETKQEVPRSKWNDWLYAIGVLDIMIPIKAVLDKNKIPLYKFNESLEKEPYFLIDSMPTRKLDHHLHKQVLKNNQYKPKESDLEDWAGLGLAACYADIVVCEKHFANMLSRDNFRTKARVISDVFKLFDGISFKSP